MLRVTLKGVRGHLLRFLLTALAITLGVSLVSNLAAGVSPTPLSAEEVLAAGRAALPRLTALLGGVLDRL